MSCHFAARVCALMLAFVLAGPLVAAQERSLREAIDAYIIANRPAIVGELVALLRLPNVAADRANIRRNAEYLQQMLARRGFAAELLETSGNPLVYGERRTAGAARTLLIYAHYDGQPVDARAWQQPDPFRPVVRDGPLASPTGTRRRAKRRRSPSSRPISASTRARRRTTKRRSLRSARRSTRSPASPRALGQPAGDSRRRRGGRLAEPRARRAAAPRQAGRRPDGDHRRPDPFVRSAHDRVRRARHPAAGIDGVRAEGWRAQW